MVRNSRLFENATLFVVSLAMCLGATAQTQSDPFVISNEWGSGWPGGTESPAGVVAPAPESRGRPPFDRNEFQDFVLQSIGRDLPIFGSNLFRQAPATFAPAENIPATSDYLVGPGDEIVIRAWGQIEVNYRATVDRTGVISIPKVGVINVTGVRNQDLTGLIKREFGRTFRNFELIANLGRLRSMQVLVVGQAKAPGTYVVSSLSTVLTTLFAAGGPSSKGSMRSIQLKRGNKVVAELDLYDLMVSGDKSNDAQLMAGDVIYIPPVGQLVALNGSVNVPGIYELKQNAPLSELLRWAGGLSTTARGQLVKVDRIEDRRTRKVEEFTLDATGLSRTLKDGDVVSVLGIGARFDNAVTLRGDVAQPARFPWREGLKVKDLIPNKEALLSQEYWLKRNQIPGMTLSYQVAGPLGCGPNIGPQGCGPGSGQSGDSASFPQLPNVQPSNNQLVVPMPRSQNQFPGLLAGNQPGSQVSASDLTPLGAGTQPGGAIARNPLMGPQGTTLAQGPSTISQAGRAIANADGSLGEPANRQLIRPPLRELNWAYATIERLNPVNLNTILIPFSLERAVIEGDPASNLSLQPGDIITVYAKEDVQVASSQKNKYVRLEGELKTAGVYQVQPGETLRQLITRVGGLAATAYLYGAEFTRESTRQQQQKSLDDMLNRMERDLQIVSASRSSGALSGEEAALNRQQTESQAALLSKLRGIRATGRIVLEVPPDGGIADVPDISLEDGDRLYVPPVPSVVNVLGAVYSENIFVYRKEKRFSDYLNQAGGPTKDADRRSLYVLRVDGSVLSQRQFSTWLGGGIEGVRLMPGDTIVVPVEFDRISYLRLFKDYAQMFYQFGLGAAAFKVLRQ